jgi:hypothetical protein
LSAFEVCVVASSGEEAVGVVTVSGTSDVAHSPVTSLDELKISLKFYIFKYTTQWIPP